MTNYLFFIGCDISKNVIDISYWDSDKPIYLGRYTNNQKGFLQIFKTLRLLTDISMDHWFFCFENTGCYSKPIFNWLNTNAISCIEGNALRISKSLGIKRGKDDKIDSKDLCRYAYQRRDTIKANKPLSPQITRLKKLLSRRNFLVKQRAALKTSLKEQKGFINNELYEELEIGNKILLKEYNKQIKDLDSKIEIHIKDYQSLSKIYHLVRSVTGIGAVTAAYLIATTNNFNSFTDSRKYACYCGIAPFPNSSGNRKGKWKVSHMANKKIKSLLSNCILAAIKHDSQIGAYYARKIKEGKSPGVVFNAIKNKIIQRVFAVVKRQTPYVKLNTYA